MRVLHLSYSNAAGVPWAWAAADYRAGHEAKCVTIVAAFGQVDAVAPDWAGWLDWAELVVVYDLAAYAERVREAGKPCVFHALGSGAVREIDRVGALDGVGVPLVATHLEFVPFGLEWVGVPVDPADVARFRRPLRHFSVCHAPTTRVHKGTEAVIRACRAAGVTLSLVEDQSHEETLRQKGRCHVLVDQIRDEYHPVPERLAGYGVNGLEAMAIGLPVLGEASPANAALLDGLEAQPIVRCSEETLPELLLRLRDDDGFYREQVREGLAYLRAYHHPQVQSARMAAVYERALEGACVPC